MSKSIYASLASILLLSACQKDNQDTSVSTKAHGYKPKVAIAPTIDNSDHSSPWNLSDEMTYSLFFKLDQKNKFNLEDPQKTKSITKRLPSHYDPFSGDLKWVKRTFSKQDFVIFLEMLKHEETPNLTARNNKIEEASANLNITMRVVVFDIREEAPEIILQEIINDTHFIPKQFNQHNFHQVNWGNEEFLISPTGMAHAQLVKEISSRIEDYILLAKEP
ncbi:MAG: hypothetical protein NTZ52_02780 [Chlamydiae bacterium]|jgi:hypothetical protein|nr:hypothetical protein [Chlamydiota bacterium]